MRGRLVDLEDAESPSQRVLLSLQSPQLLPGGGYVGQRLCNRDAIAERAVGLKLFGQGGYVPLEVLCRVEQPSLELLLHRIYRENRQPHNVSCGSYKSKG